MKTTIMFTALPNGKVAGDSKLKVSVLVSPRLTDVNDGETLASSLFQDWPAIARALSFRVLFGTPDKVFPAELAPALPLASPRFDSVLWKKLFPGTTKVTPFGLRDYRKGSVASFNAKTVADTVRDEYKATASASTVRPVLGAHNAARSAIGSRIHEVASVVKQTKAGGKAIVPRAGQTQPLLSKAEVAKVAPSGASAESKEFLRSAVFYNRGDWKKELGVPEAPVAAPDAPDFHAIIGHLGDHPMLLRRLGLIIDLVLAPPPGMAGEIDIAVLPADVPGTTLLRPWTFARLGADGIWPWYNGNEITANGLLALDSPVFHVDDLDVDHAAVEFIDFAEKTQEKLDAGETVEAALPALRTVGLTVYRDDRELVTGDHFNRPYVIQNNPSGLRFVADELVRGYRVDVQSGAGGEWMSLCKRVARITIADTTLEVPDEGFIKSSSLAAVSGGSQAIMNVHESLFHWDGWSLVARRPGRAVTAVPTGPDTQGERPEHQRNVAPASMQLPLGIDIKPQDRTLPRLRYGKDYRFRIRAVDLAGNDLARGVGAAPAGDAVDHPSQSLKLRRYEPVSPPTLVLRSSLTEGESVEHLVVRTNPYGAIPLTDAASYAAWANTITGDATAPGPMGTYGATCERHVAPPKVSQHMAELHGAFDAILTAPITKEKAQTAYTVALKEEGTFLDTQVTDTTTLKYKTVDTGRLIVTPLGARNPDGTRPQRPDPRAPIPRGEALAHGEYVVLPNENVILPYLPDPNCAGVTMRGLAGSTMLRPFVPREPGGAWPEIGMFRLVLAAKASGGVSVTGADASGSSVASTTPVTVTLPPATLTTFDYSAMVRSPDVMAFAPAGMEDVVKKGLHALVSPPRKITLVHAVQQPAPPVWRDYELAVNERAEGETAARVVANVRVDGPSTAHVDVVATWNEYVDGVAATPGAPIDSSADPSQGIPRRGTLASLQVEYDTTTLALPPDTKHYFGDTKRRTVTYSAVATTRYREYFPPAITRDPANITNASPGLTRIIKSTARPPVPRVACMVPTFKWDERVEGGGIKRTRVGGGLRVYVERGWFATGEDERLAVVLAPSAAALSANPDYFSVWGGDPIWYTRDKLGALATAHFPGDPRDRYRVLKDVALADDPNVKANVVTFVPQWSKERKLWYFDVELTADASYFPFVRLVLARCQAESIADLRLSRVVKTDFAQVVPDRTATVTDRGDDTFTVTLYGPVGANVVPGVGTGRRLARDAASGHVVTAEFQESVRTTNPDELDWKTMGPPVILDPYVDPATPGPSSTVTFQGTLPYPTGRAIPGTLHRVLVREYEIFACDDQATVAKGVGTVHEGAAEPPSPYGQRLVYTGAIRVAR